MATNVGAGRIERGAAAPELSGENGTKTIQRQAHPSRTGCVGQFRGVERLLDARDVGASGGHHVLEKAETVLAGEEVNRSLTPSGSGGDRRRSLPRSHPPNHTGFHPFS